MQEQKNKIEAILFTTGRFMSLQEISDFCGLASIGLVKEAIEELKKDYESKETSLTISEEKGKYKLSIRKKYNYLTTKLLDVAEMDKPTQETLATIAYKQPAIQAEIIKIRGNKAYDHISSLKELDFITSEKYGRTRLLKLTQKFFDYFDLVEDQVKEKFSNFEKLEEHTKELAKDLEESEDQTEESSQEDGEQPQEDKDSPQENEESSQEESTENLQEKKEETTEEIKQEDTEQEDTEQEDTEQEEIKQEETKQE